jgi:hypothetical protein
VKKYCRICLHELTPKAEHATCPTCRDRLRALLDGLGREELAVLRAQVSARLRLNPYRPATGRQAKPTNCRKCGAACPSARLAWAHCAGRSPET